MSARATRRQVLAFIALADAPMPKTVSFEYGHSKMVDLDVDDEGTLRQWAELFGISPDKIRTSTWTTDGVLHSSTSARHYKTSWRGWEVRIEASSKQAVEEPIDDATREQLVTIAAEADSNPCPYTQSHTREFCGNPTCRES